VPVPSWSNIPHIQDVDASIHFNTICMLIINDNPKDVSRIWFMQQPWCLSHVDCFHGYYHRCFDIHNICYPYCEECRQKALTRRITIILKSRIHRSCSWYSQSHFWGTSNMGREWKGNFGYTRKSWSR
jgi:hypothetical protein